MSVNERRGLLLRLIMCAFCFMMIGFYSAIMMMGISDHWRKIENLEDHIEYLEEYIEENCLPTPAIRIRK